MDQAWGILIKPSSPAFVGLTSRADFQNFSGPGHPPYTGIQREMT